MNSEGDAPVEIKLNRKRIEDACGTVSLKRGEIFQRKKKVKLIEIEQGHVKGTVTAGNESFEVVIEAEANGSFHSSCSCPKLSSFQKDCQHVAAVLLTLLDRKRMDVQGDRHQVLRGSSEVEESTEKLFRIFQGNQVQKNGRQRHFENRQIVQAAFTCIPVTAGGKLLFGLSLTVAETEVKDIRGFLENIRQHRSSELSDTFLFDPSAYCFDESSDTVLQHLIQVVQDEKIYLEKTPFSNPAVLLIPPSSWKRLESLLAAEPHVTLSYQGNVYDGLRLVDDPLPLQFRFSKADGECFALEITGMDDAIFLHEYRTALLEGRLILLKDEENQRLEDLREMMKDFDTNRIPIPPEQVKFFTETVVPGLQRMGKVEFTEEAANRMEKTPLKAKLFLDRVKERLLASLEFHYGKIIIHPQAGSRNRTASMVIRDLEKEERILQLMKKSAFAETEGGYLLHNEELEYEFLHHILPDLEKLVHVYATTAVRNRIVRKSPRPKIRVHFRRERTNWLEFKFDLDGIAEDDIRGVLASLESKRKYHRLKSGALLSLETREFEEIERFLTELPIQDDGYEKTLDTVEVPFLEGFRLMDRMADEEAFQLEESFRSFLSSLNAPAEESHPAPASLENVLREYQKEGFRWMKTLAANNFGGILADDMGLGKTLQAITYIASIREADNPVLIVCPAAVTYNWLNELLKFTPGISAIVMDGNAEQRSKLQKEYRRAEVLITSYPMLRSDIKWYESREFHTIIFDEAQAFKNPMTQTARAVKKLVANHRFALTGTPVENSPEDLWSIFHVVFPGLFGGLKDFGNLTRKQIARRTKPFLLRRMKEDVATELPGKMESLELVDLLPEQKRLYASFLAKLRHDTLKHLDKDTIRKNKIRILAGLTRLRQICCHPSLFVEGYEGTSAKFEQLLRILEEARVSRRRVLVFSQFTSMLEIIGRELEYQGRAYFYLDGQTAPEERVDMCSRFNGGEKDIFLISLKAGGTGLNLTGADTVILYDLWWNPAVEEQAADRAHRIGQKETVHVIKMISKGTIEEKMNELQERKRDLIAEIIQPTRKDKEIITEEDIRVLLGI